MVLVSDELTYLMLYNSLKITFQTSTPRLNPWVCWKWGGSRHARSLLCPVFPSLAMSSTFGKCPMFHLVVVYLCNFELLFCRTLLKRDAIFNKGTWIEILQQRFHSRDSILKDSWIIDHKCCWSQFINSFLKGPSELLSYERLLVVIDSWLGRRATGLSWCIIFTER